MVKNMAGTGKRIWCVAVWQTIHGKKIKIIDLKINVENITTSGKIREKGIRGKENIGWSGLYFKGDIEWVDGKKRNEFLEAYSPEVFLN